MEEPTSRAVLVTGGSGPIGKAVALELARRGWSIFLQVGKGESSEEVLAAARSAAEQAGCSIEADAACADPLESAGREQLVEQAMEAFGRIDMLVVSPAAPAPPQDLLEMGEEDLRQALETSLAAPLLLGQLVANEMVRLVEAGMIENPRIVMISHAAEVGPHCIAQSAMGTAVRLLAARLAEHGIQVCEVRAGAIKTGPADAAHERTPLRRAGRPQDVARAVAALAGDLLDFSTGEVLHVDGGLHLRGG